MPSAETFAGERAGADPMATFEGVLFDGEDVLLAERLGEAGVAVTTHRVLAADPAGDGPRLSAALLPNVTGVSVGSSGHTPAAVRAGGWGLLGAVLVGAGLVVDLDGLVRPVEAPAALGLGGFLEFVSVLSRTLGLVDEGLLALGAAGLLGAAFHAVWFLASRQRRLVVEVAGDDPITLPVDAADAGATARVRSAIERVTGDG